MRFASSKEIAKITSLKQTVSPFHGFRDPGYFFSLRKSVPPVPRSGIFLRFAGICSAIRDFSSICGTGQGISSALVEKNLFCGNLFRNPGFFFDLRESVPRFGIFLRFAEQDRGFLPLKWKEFCFAEICSAIRDFPSICGNLFRDMVFLFALRNRTGWESSQAEHVTG
jgi:hypothetical protein